jgi:hypothetical protein
MMHSLITSAVASALLLSQAVAHTWVEQIMAVDANGNYTGAPGYPRGYVERGSPGFSDTKLTYLIPANGLPRSRINASDALCRPEQAVPNTNGQNFPSLRAVPGSYISMRYLENGHVTLPANQVGKPGSGGLVYIYATTQPKSDQKLLDTLSWTTTSDLSEGRLLAINNYDDGRCFQISGSAMSVQRQKEFADPIPGQPGTNQERWCESNFQLPANISDGNLAVYWVWQWPTLPNMDPGLPNGKDEIYSTCSDFVISNNANAVKAAVGGQKLILQDTSTDAPPDFKERAANLTSPANTAFYGASNSGNNTSSPSQPPAQPPAQPMPSPPFPTSLPPFASSLPFASPPPFASLPPFASPPAGVLPSGLPPFASTFLTNIRTSTKTQYITVTATTTAVVNVPAPTGAKFR